MDEIKNGEDLSNALIALGIKRKDFATIIGRHANTVQRWCSDDLVIPPVVKTVFRLCWPAMAVHLKAIDAAQARLREIDKEIERLKTERANYLDDPSLQKKAIADLLNDAFTEYRAEAATAEAA